MGVRERSVCQSWAPDWKEVLWPRVDFLRPSAGCMVFPFFIQVFVICVFSFFIFILFLMLCAWVSGWFSQTGYHSLLHVWVFRLYGVFDAMCMSFLLFLADRPP